MGVCKKCKKISPFFCYHCRNTVCYDCVCDLEHRIAPVVPFSAYLLNPGDCDSVCPLTQRIITENDEVIRFMNMQLFLLTAINEYGLQKSSTIIFLNELTIPGTEEPMLPSPEDKSKLAQEIRTKLSQFNWFKEKPSANDSTYVSRTPSAVISPPIQQHSTAFISTRKPTTSPETIIDIQETQSDDPQGKNRQKRKIYEFISSVNIKLNMKGILLYGGLFTIFLLFLFVIYLTLSTSVEPQELTLTTNTIGDINKL